MGRRVVLSVSVALAACGGAAAPVAPAASGAPGPSLGTTGIAGLDWGASSDAVLAVRPAATPSPGGLTLSGPVEGRDATSTYAFDAAGLSQIQIDWREQFPSMQACSEHWSTLRARLDARFGPSQSDNLAAYWATGTARITLECHPDDTGVSGLSLSYAPPEP